MLPEMIKSVVKKLFAEDYPHLKLPAIVYAKVSAARKLDARSEEHTSELQSLSC